MAHMHIYGGIHGGGGGNTTFGGFVFASTGQPVSGKSKDKTSTTVTSPVKITFKSSRDRKYNEIRGKVQQLFKDKAHHGLIIELYGTLQLKGHATLQLTLASQNASTSSQSLASFPLTGPQNSENSHVTTKAYQKFPFVLNFPEDLPLPPTFSCPLGSVSYKIVVSMRVNQKLVLLEEQEIYYFGEKKISPSDVSAVLKHLVIAPSHPGEQLTNCSVAHGNANISMQLPKRDFLSGEDILFNIKLSDPDKSGGVKLIRVFLLRSVLVEVRGHRDRKEDAILDVVTFKRFLKRGETLRSGKFKWDSIPTASYAGRFGGGINLVGISYRVEIKVTTTTGEILANQIEIVVGTREGSLTPTAPEESVDGPSAPPLGDDDDNQTPVPSAPRRSFASWGLVASSMLSLLPPSYSQLPSRSESLISLETLPPHYDDLVDSDNDDK